MLMGYTLSELGSIFAMQAFAGLILFSVFVLMALGLAIIFGQMGVINMAHGEFIMAGAYTVSRDGHVRGDVVYRLWPPRVQAAVDLALYVLFYFPAVLALIYSGYVFARLAWMFGETSVYSPASIPVWQLKALIPLAGIVLALQGISEIVRCWRCIKTGEWPVRYQDVEEMESAILHAHEDEMRMRAEHQRDARVPGTGADR